MYTKQEALKNLLSKVRLDELDRVTEAVASLNKLLGFNPEEIRRLHTPSVKNLEYSTQPPNFDRMVVRSNTLKKWNKEGMLLDTLVEEKHFVSYRVPIQTDRLSILEGRYGKLYSEKAIKLAYYLNDLIANEARSNAYGSNEGNDLLCCSGDITVSNLIVQKSLNSLERELRYCKAYPDEILSPVIIERLLLPKDIKLSSIIKIKKEK